MELTETKRAVHEDRVRKADKIVIAQRWAEAMAQPHVTERELEPGQIDWWLPIREEYERN